MIRNRILLAFLAATLLPFPARAQSPQRAPLLVPTAPERPIEVELRSAARAVAPGDTIPVAIRLLPNRGWHTYWRHAGDVGSAPDIAWRLPDGFTAALLRWPAPERIDAPPLASYGYDGEVHLLGALHAWRSVSRCRAAACRLDQPRRRRDARTRRVPSPSLEETP